MKYIESGRSMLEMLGVLAVIGLVSIGGLYGYTQAVKRHKANELINEANKRAVVAAAQLMTGKDPEDVNMGEFPTDTPYGSFVSTLAPVGKDKFKMSVSGLDEEVCELMKRSADGPLRRVDCVAGEATSFTAEMVFNKDLSTEVKASDYTYENCPNTFYKCEANETCVASASDCAQPAVECSGHGHKDTDDNCDCEGGWSGFLCDDCDGFVANDGTCHNCSETEASEATFTECAKCKDVRGNAAREMNNEFCILLADACFINPTTDCLSGALLEEECTCAPADDDTECTSWTNNECGKEKYCRFSPGPCTDSLTGMCKPVSYINDYTEINPKTATVDNHKYTTADTNQLTWWSAQSWCKAFGKRLVSLSDAGCNRSTGSCSNKWDDLSSISPMTGTWTTDLSTSSCYAIGLRPFDRSPSGAPLGGGNLGALCY